MPQRPQNWLATRTTLLCRLRDWEDESSWSHFFETYGPVIYGVALKAGLSREDAEEVVQETVITVAKRVKEFQYDRTKGSFKSWLLTVARSKMVDRWRKHQRQPHLINPATEVDRQTKFIDRAADAKTLAPDKLWDDEWRTNLISAAQERLKTLANPRHFQVFDCLVNKGWAPEVIAEKLKIKVEQVYVIRQRLTAQLKTEVDLLRAEWGEA